MKQLLRSLLRSFPGLNQFIFLKGALKGHFYSPIPNLKEIERDRHRIFEALPTQIPGVDLREDEQLELVRVFARDFYKSQPFGVGKTDDLAYFFENEAFRYGDAIMLYCMLRHFRPKRFVEIGSGFSSCATLDTNRLFFNNSMECVFIDPYPAVLKTLISGTTGDGVQIIGKRVQDVSMEVFSRLRAGDMLFIDSSHVSKAGSDVNYIFFNILPELQPGVRVHLHDVFYPFEYPEQWVLDGRSWSEAYLLRAFLQFNQTFAVELFPNYLMRFHTEFFERHMPLCVKDPGGSIWIRKN